MMALEKGPPLWDSGRAEICSANHQLPSTWSSMGLIMFDWLKGLSPGFIST